jgi:uncharacterized protein (TIGR02145 family)
MKKQYYIIILLLLLTGLRANSQKDSVAPVIDATGATFAAVQTKTGFTRLDNDSVVLTTSAGLRGTLQWQNSTDLVTWTDVASTLPGTVLAFKPQTTKVYRLKITEGTCNPIYGDTIKVFAMGTTPGAYIQAGVSVTDLFSAGVQSSELLPTITTTSISGKSQTSAIGGGNITSEGCTVVASRGVCWNITGNPTIANSKTTDGTGPGSFTSPITGLNPGTTYYVSAYATNSAGSSYGTVQTFTTLPSLEAPVVNTSDVGNLTQTNATGGGNVTSAGTATVTASGICWNTSSGPTTANNKTTDGTGTGTFTSSITGLTASTTYYVRAYATSSAGTSYGSEKTFTTPALSAPIVNTADVSSIMQTTATCGGNVSSAGTSTVTAMGICWNTSSAPTTANSKTTDGTGTGTFTSSLTGLTATTTYYVRAYATNTTGTSYGAEKVFTTPAHIPPVVNTADVNTITPTSASCGGNVTSAGTLPVTARGVCWNTTGTPTTADYFTSDSLGTGAFNSKITGLTPDMKYYVRAYAQSLAGTSYGEEKNFRTIINLGSAKVKDYDGNLYDTVTIGKQIWLKQNLKVTHYNNGDLIPLYTASTTVGARAYYNNDSATFAPTYGAYYNYYAVVDSRNLCPSGWYVPAFSEWQTIISYLGGVNAGDRMKETGTAHWQAPTTATNSSGFTALPGGVYNDYSRRPGLIAVFWSSTQYTTESASALRLWGGNSSELTREYLSRKQEFSVRCLKSILPAVTTAALTNKTPTSVVCGGNVTSYGSPTTARGVCWIIEGSGVPTISNSKTTDGFGAGSFTSSITGLSPGKSYYLSAYATNASGTTYGTPVYFTTPALATTGDITEIDTTRAMCGGTVYPLAVITDKGLCWNITGNPTILDNKVSNTYPSAGFNSYMTGLTPNTTYTVRAYATSAGSTSYGDPKTFTTHASNTYPTVTTSNASGINITSAICGGDVKFEGTSPVTERGICWAPVPYYFPTIADYHQADAHAGLGAFSMTISGLTQGTVYIVRAYAINSSGISYGSSIGFITQQNLPTVTLGDITRVYTAVATCTGNVTSLGDYNDMVTKKGVCWGYSTDLNLSNCIGKTENGTGLGIYTSTMKGLSAGEAYIVRAYATNSFGTAYSDYKSYSITKVTKSDVDGNVYEVIDFGIAGQWFKENLNVTHYRNGDAIPLVTDDSQWLNLTSAAYCNYSNDENNAALYGRLYNFYTAVDNRNLCPTGWHVPTMDEFNSLIDLIGWNAYDYESINTYNYGFSALSGGCRLVNYIGYPQYNYVVSFSGGEYWWTSSTIQNVPYPPSPCYFGQKTSYMTVLYGDGKYGTKNHGFSVRCKKD